MSENKPGGETPGGEAPGGTMVEFHRPVAINDLPPEGRTVRLEAGEAERAALARRLGLVSLDSLTAEATVSPRAGGIGILGSFEAQVVQSCGVTLAPLPGRVAATFERTYAEDPAAWSVEDDEEGWFDPEADMDPPDALIGNSVDVGEAVVEQLSLELDPWPRDPDAEFEGWHAAPEGSGKGAGEKAGPFAALAKLRRESD